VEGEALRAGTAEMIPWVLRVSVIWCFVLVALQACVSGPPVLSPPPARIDALDGYVSLSLRRESGSVKTRFSFRFILPDKGRIEALDLFGRTLAILIFNEGDSWLALPLRHAYWTGPEEELMEKFLGFGLKAGELARILCGRWDGAGGWNLDLDPLGRVLGGEREGFRFEVSEFFGGASVPLTVAFSLAGRSGRVRVLKIQFNRPSGGDLFGLSILKGLEPRTWTEIEALLQDEN
jgi:hypothetical protein